MATTPSCGKACETSMLLIFACAYGLRRNAAWSMFGKSTSSTYNPCPISRRGSSLRLIRSPKYRVAINSPITFMRGGRVVLHARGGTYRDHTFTSYLTFESNYWSRHLYLRQAQVYGLERAPSLTRPTGYSSPRHRATERGFSTFELPWKDSQRDALVVQFLQADVAAKIFHMDAIVREQGIMSKLVC